MAQAQKKIIPAAAPVNGPAMPRDRDPNKPAARQLTSVAEILRCAPHMGGNPHARETASDQGKAVIFTMADAWNARKTNERPEARGAEAFDAGSLGYFLAGQIGAVAYSIGRAADQADAAAEKLGAYMGSEARDRDGVYGFAAESAILQERAQLADARTDVMVSLFRGMIAAYEEATGETWKPYVKTSGPVTHYKTEAEVNAAAAATASYLANRRAR